MTWLRRNSDRTGPLDEATAYARCHGARDESVRIVKLPPRRVHYDVLLATGEDIRRSLEARIDARDSDGDSAPVTAPQQAEHEPEPVSGVVAPTNAS